MNEKIDQFAEQVKEKMAHVRTLSGSEAEDANNELSVFIAQQMSVLLSAGANVVDVQNALRAATDEVPQTYAPDADDSVLDEEDTLEALGEIEPAQLFFPVDTSFIQGYASGTVDEEAFVNTLLQCPMLCSRYYEAVLSTIAKKDENTLSPLFFGGEIVADANGEAFIFQAIEGTLNGVAFSMCEPALFISPNEVKQIASILANIEPSTLLKFHNLHTVKKAFIPAHQFDKQDMQDDFIAVCTFINTASQENKGLLTFPIY